MIVLYYMLLTVRQLEVTARPLIGVAFTVSFYIIMTVCSEAVRSIHKTIVQLHAIYFTKRMTRLLRERCIRGEISVPDMYLRQ